MQETLKGESPCKMAVLIHVLSNLFYAIVGFAGWDILA